MAIIAEQIVKQVSPSQIMHVDGESLISTETWLPVEQILATPIVDVVDDEYYEGHIIWADSQWALQESQHGLVRHNQTAFYRNLIPGMNITVYYPGEGLQCFLVGRDFYESEYKTAALRIFVMQIFGVTASHHSTDPLNSFKIPEGRGCIKLSNQVREGISCVYLHEIQSYPTGKGGGRRMMEALCAAADEIEVTMALSVQPLGNKFLNKEQLVIFYEKFGFIKGSRECFFRAYQNP